MFKIGALVRHKTPSPRLGITLGVLLKENCGMVWEVYWINGKQYSEAQIYLEVLCK